MAYTPAPENQTYSTHRIPAAFPIDLRPGSLSVSSASSSIQQDAGMVNMLPVLYEDPITHQKSLVAETRPAIVGTTITTAAAPTAVLRGFYMWEKTVGTIYCFAVVGTNVYSTTTPEVATTWAVVNTLLTASNAPVRFTEYIDDVNTKKLILVDGVEGYVYTTNAAGTKIVDADFPTPHLPWPVFMDGYLFLAKANTGDIYNSNLNDPAAWTAGDFISSELYPDDVQAIVKINNYILAIGSTGCEYFLDAANANGSPLARYEGGSLPFGCSLPNSIAVNKNSLTMIANSNDGQMVLKVIEDFKHKDLNSSFVIPMLNSRIRNNASITAAGVRGYLFRQSGKLYYGLKFCGDRIATDPTIDTSAENPTLIYSFDTDSWTEFTYGNSGTVAFPVSFSSMPTTTNLATYVAGSAGTELENWPFVGVLREGETVPGAESAVDIIRETDTIYQEMRTPNIDFGTFNVKSMHRLGIYFELGYPSTAPIEFSVQWNDYDYEPTSWTTARTITKTPGSFTYPFINQLGMFRSRAFRIINTSGSWIRAKVIEMDINKGQQ
jgi:hypothetical protein